MTIMPKPKSPKTNKSTVELASNSMATRESNSGNGSPETVAPEPLATEAVKAEMKTAKPPKIRKPRVVKSESRSNLVPINLEDEIRRLAYLLSERRGFSPGHESEDWITAEREIRARYHQQSA